MQLKSFLVLVVLSNVVNSKPAVEKATLWRQLLEQLEQCAEGCESLFGNGPSRPVCAETRDGVQQTMRNMDHFDCIVSCDRIAEAGKSYSAQI